MEQHLFGVENDRIAAEQLGLAGNWDIFLMDVQAECVDDIEAIRKEIEDQGHVDVNEILSRFQDFVRPVRLPKGFKMVGMRCLDDPDAEPVYGVVNLLSGLAS